MFLWESPSGVMGDSISLYLLFSMDCKGEKGAGQRYPKEDSTG
ncbi:MAG TPA: hypothetical protein VJ953_02360 [Saprospiraceae bacterium]|nr:hypothetical protein [Saprospiraceae bacterium]